MARVKQGRYKGLPKNDVLIAKAMANAQYGPKLSALQSMVQQAGEDYLTDVAAAKGAARATIRGARRARKPTAKVFNRATQAAQTAASDVQSAFGALGAAADPFEAVTAREHGAALTRIAETKANALNELKSRKQEARAGRALGLAQARGTFRSDVRKLQQQGADIRSQRGNYIAGQLGTLANERAERRAKAREGAANRQTQLDVANTYANQNKGKGGGGGGGGGGGRGPSATPGQTGDALDTIQTALKWGRTLKGGKWNLSFDDALDLLTKGAKAQPVYKRVPDPKNPGQYKRVQKLVDGVPVMTDDVPKISQGLLLRAALEQVYVGRVSHPTQRALKRQGLGPLRLNLNKAKNMPKGVAGPAF